MNTDDEGDSVTREILFQYILIEKSRDWLEKQITSKLEEITLIEGQDSEKERVLRGQLKMLYYRCSFEKRQMDSFIQKYGYAIPTPTGAF